MNWLHNLEEARTEAEASRKPILLQFEMEGCGGCKKLYEETYSDHILQKEMTDNFVLLKLDLIKERELRKSLGAYWTPSFYFLTEDLKSRFNFNGFVPPLEARAILRLGMAEFLAPKGKYSEAAEFLKSDLKSFERSSLYSKMLYQIALMEYIKTKDKNDFKSKLKFIAEKYPDTIEAKTYFFD
jgi:thioredoxin-related protein